MLEFQKITKPIIEWIVKQIAIANGNWTKNHTFADRYVVTGITKLILAHTRNSKKKIIIMDVGCSKGVAIKHAQDCLKQENIESFTIGIDVSENIAKEANENLNKFINKDVLQVYDCTEKADIVICSKVIIFVTGELKYKIIKKCSEFLKNDGILITDDLLNEKYPLLEELKLIQYMFPNSSPFKKDFYQKYRMRFYTPLRKKMKKISKSDVINYAEDVLSSWQRLSYIQKWFLKFDTYWRLGMNLK